MEIILVVVHFIYIIHIVAFFFLWFDFIIVDIPETFNHYCVYECPVCLHGCFNMMFFQISVAEVVGGRLSGGGSGLVVTM